MYSLRFAVNRARLDANLLLQILDEPFRFVQDAVVTVPLALDQEYGDEAQDEADDV